MLLTCALSFVLSCSQIEGVRVRRQSSKLEIVCSACNQQSNSRIEEKPPQVCCRCIDNRATCNNRIARGRAGSDTGSKVKRALRPGLTCRPELECEVFGKCDSKRGCEVEGFNVVDAGVGLIDIRGEEKPNCPFGQRICCNPVAGGVFETKLGLVSVGNNSGELKVDTQALCEDPKLSAVQDFDHGVTCGKRDARVYYDANLPNSFTNPGEWPWAVLIFNGGVYIGSGALMDNDVVVTVGHKVKDFVTDPRGLKVRLGDWNPNVRDGAEEFPHIEKSVLCVRLHPDADLDNTLANNVAVLKLDTVKREKFTNIKEETVASVIDFKKGLLRPADNPNGVEGSSIIGGSSLLDTRLGLVSQDLGVDPLGTQRNPESEVVRSYINTVCLPKSEHHFQNFGDRCWVAAWGKNLKRQREVDLPLVTRSQCERRLRPIFEEKGVQNWSLKPSEMCAGGVRGKDTCQGEGGAPLVCYDKGSDQYFAAGLVSYGFGCNNTRPAVYTNLADHSVKQFITSSFSNNSFC